MLWTAKGNLVSDFSSKCPILPEHILAQAHIILIITEDKAMFSTFSFWWDYLY